MRKSSAATAAASTATNAAADQGLLGDLSLEQIGQIVHFISYASSAPGIGLQGGLIGLAADAALDLELRVSSRDRKTKLATSRRLRLLTPRGRVIFDVSLRPSAYYRAAVAKEGLGGYVADGDWWGYNSRDLAIQFAHLTTGFRSDKLGRGSHWGECEEAVREYYRAIKK